MSEEVKNLPSPLQELYVELHGVLWRHYAKTGSLPEDGAVFNFPYHSITFGAHRADPEARKKVLREVLEVIDDERRKAQQEAEADPYWDLPGRAPRPLGQSRVDRVRPPRRGRLRPRRRRRWGAGRRPGWRR